MPDDPFRSELEVAHQRIEKLEAEHKTRVEALERENARLRERLIDSTTRAGKSGRTFLTLGMIILAVSIFVGILFARVTSRITDAPSHEPALTLELPSQMAPSDFDSNAVEGTLAAVRLDDCSPAADGQTAGHAKITFAPSGTVSSVLVDHGPYQATSVAHCIEDHYRAVRVPAFSGPPRVVGKAFTVP